MLPIHESSFFWRSELTSKRKQEIIDWVKSLSEKDKGLLLDLLRDTREDADFNGREEALRYE